MGRTQPRAAASVALATPKISSSPLRPIPWRSRATPAGCLTNSPATTARTPIQRERSTVATLANPERELSRADRATPGHRKRHDRRSRLLHWD
jgi:hypothetical protein